jgi:ATP-binding cassette subfamily B protein
VVVDDSGVVEQGRHQDLIALGGVYGRLHAAQFDPIPA